MFSLSVLLYYIIIKLLQESNQIVEDCLLPKKIVEDCLLVRLLICSRC